MVSELSLNSGRRADLVALGPDGELWIIEIKSSIEDFRADQKWRFYRMHCDRLFFAGEHTSIRWQGYMNGAVESGRRAAAEIVAVHRSNTQKHSEP